MHDIQDAFVLHADALPAHSYAQESMWIALPLAGERKPCPRYEHCSALVGTKMYTIGGNYGASGWVKRFNTVHTPWGW